jgi:signal transduction histidine kinase
MNDLAEYAKIDNGALKINKSTINVADLVTKVVNDCNAKYTNKNIEASVVNLPLSTLTQMEYVFLRFWKTCSPMHLNIQSKDQLPLMLQLISHITAHTFILKFQTQE